MSISLVKLIDTLGPRCSYSSLSFFQRLVWVVSTFAKDKRDQTDSNLWKTFAVYSGATLQLAVSIVVFTYLGHRLANQTHHSWITIVGAVVGVIVGASGLAFLAKKILGDQS